MDDPQPRTTILLADDDTTKREVTPLGKASMGSVSGARQAPWTDRLSILPPKLAYLADWVGRAPGIPTGGEDD